MTFVILKGRFVLGQVTHGKGGNTARGLKMLKRLRNKKKLNPNLTVRSKITIFIAKQKSWQEFALLVGDLIDKSHIEPLHLKNNACALAHRPPLNTVISWSKLTIFSFSKDHHIVFFTSLLKF